MPNLAPPLLLPALSLPLLSSAPPKRPRRAEGEAAATWEGVRGGWGPCCGERAQRGAEAKGERRGLEGEAA